MTERTKPLTFIVEEFELYVPETNAKPTWAATCYWDEADGCFVLDSDGPGNYDFAPCDLEELARILRAMPRSVP